MNAKNLPLKFAFVLLLALASLWSVLKGNGLRLGIDLRGGHSLVYGIMTNAREIDENEKKLAKLTDALATETDPAKKKELSGKIERVEQEITRLRAGGDDGDLSTRMIEILKNRVDPGGLKNLEWRPMGNDRFEVRMPAAKEDTQRRQEKYEQAMKRLLDGNIEDFEIRQILKAGPGVDTAPASVEALRKVLADRRPARMAEAKKLVGDNKKLLKWFTELFDASDAKDLAAKGDDEDARKNAYFAYDTKLKEIRSYNINALALESVLSNFVPPSESGVLYVPPADDGKDKYDRRRAEYEKKLEELSEDKKTTDLAKRLGAYEVGLARLKEAHADRAAAIDAVAAEYRDWLSVRQYLEDPDDLKRLIAKAGQLTFRIAPVRGPSDTDYTLSDTRIEKYQSKLLEPGGAEEMRAASEPFLWFPARGETDRFDGLIVGLDDKGQPHVLLSNKPAQTMLSGGVGGWRLARAYKTTDNRNLPAVGFTFDELGAKQFAQLTAANKEKRMAILLDDEAFSAPVIKAVISERGIIEMGKSDANEVSELVRLLEAGALPGKLNPKPLSENSFGPAIGQENMRAGLRAGFIGLIAVAAFMLVYYLLAGAIADAALMLNIILVMGAMSLLNAVLTLPGIAGIILTIGIAVDANVLIFERLREEQSKGQSPRMALKTAYERAFSAIFDANITTLITCLILGWVATEEVRGFAITLGLGVAVSLFTALVVTRWLFQVLLDTRLLAKPIRMLSILGTPKIDWMGKRYIFWAVSATMIVLGVTSLIWQGKGILGIEFSSGTKAVFQFRDDALLEGKALDDSLVRERFIANATTAKGGSDKLVSTARVETLYDNEQAADILSRRDTGKDGKISLAEWTQQGLDQAAFALYDQDGNKSLDREELRKMPSLSYQLSTTEPDVSIIRDVAAKAFGTAQRRRPKCEFEWVKDENRKVLGQRLASNGHTRIQAVQDIEESDLLDKFDGGVMFVIHKVTPPIDEQELLQRVRILRRQTITEKDLQGLSHNETAARLLGMDADGLPEFAVLIRPAEPPANWEEFAGKEAKLLTEALHREEAMIVNNFDPQIAGETRGLAIVAIVLSWGAIVLYLWLRFGSIQWGLAAVICLVHDVIIVVGLVAVSGWLYDTFLGRALGISSFKIDLAMIAAVLTVIGYSVNDTIVVFDRIRENRGKLKVISAETINTSINQTLSRTLLTSTTTFIVVFVMYAWGGTGIRHFNYALLAGILFGTYSSVAVASPLLMGFRKALIARAAKSEQASE